MWEKKDEIDRKVELMGDADMAKWLHSNREWLAKPKATCEGLKPVRIYETDNKAEIKEKIKRAEFYKAFCR